MTSQAKFCLLLFFLHFTSRFCESKTRSYSHQHKVLNVGETSHTLLKYPLPPLRKRQFHVASSELDKKALESTLRLGPRIDTLVITMPDSKEGSINEVKIEEWDIYNDGHVIVHAIEDLFDPAYQTLRYPQYDGGVSNGEDRSSAREDGLDVKGSSEAGGRFSCLKDVVKGMINMPLLVIAVGFLVFAIGNLGHLYRKEHEY